MGNWNDIPGQPSTPAPSTPASAGSWNDVPGGSAPSAAPTSSGGGGLLHTIGHVFSQGASDLEHAAVNLPAGLAHVGSTVGKTFYYDARYGPTSEKATAQRKMLANLEGGMVKATAQDLEHPLRHPGYTLLDVLPVASGAARIGIAGKIGERTLRVGGAELHPELSRSGLGAAAQVASDKLLQTAADKKPGGFAETLLHRKAGKVVTAEARTRGDIYRGPSAALIAAGKKLTPAEQKALQVVAEEAPLHERITAASARVIGAKDAAARARHQTELDLLHQAKPLLSEEGGKPAFAAGKSHAKLTSLLGKMRDVAGSREQLLQDLNLLTDEAIQSRKAGAARVAIRQPLEHPPGIVPPTPGQLSLIPEPEKAPLFEPSPEAVRVPDVATNGPRSLGRNGSVGTQGTIGHQRLPGSVSHEYTGALRENALRREDTTRLVGESGLEAAKFAAIKHVHDMARQIAKASPTPIRETDIAVRLDKLKTSDRLPLEVKKFVSDPEEFFNTSSPAEQASMLDKVKAQLFIDPKTLDSQAAAEFNRLADQGKIGWVPRRVLGEFAKPQASLQAVAGRGPVKVWDAINNAQRFAILYLKPAYAVPNLLGNAALNLIQQGFAAPVNLARAARLNAQLGADAAARIDSLMGEGLARAVSSRGQGFGAAVIDKAAGGWSKIVDTPFRRASFIHEARRAGFKTPKQLEALLTNQANERKLMRVTQTANREAIDYANLTPAEREIVRRVVFFYPWVKGSTVYAGRMLREHPIASAASGALGAQGQQWSQGVLGPLPSYLEGLIPVGGGEVINPNSSAILQTPAQVAEALQGLLSGNISEAAQASNFSTPALNLLLALALRKNLASGYSYPGGTSALKVAEDTLGASLPQATLARNISGAGKHPERLYPPSMWEALAQFLAGGVAPRQINLERAHALAEKEQTMMHSGYGR